MDISAYADMMMTAERGEDVVAMTLWTKENAEKVGLIINQEKTEVMKLSRHYDGATEQIRIEDVNLKLVKKLKYLGAWFTPEKNVKLEIEEKIMFDPLMFP